MNKTASFLISFASIVEQQYFKQIENKKYIKATREEQLKWLPQNKNKGGNKHNENNNRSKTK